jgi:LPXTG-motif cell wall-anchored protein
VPKRLQPTTAGRRLVLASLVAAAVTLATTTLGAPAARAAAGWSRSPASGIGGGTVHVASSSDTLCQGTQPATTTTTAAGTPTADAAAGAAPDPGAAGAAPAAAGGDTVSDGTEVRFWLAQETVAVALGTVPVTEGGAWSGTLTVPSREILAPGEYQMHARCVVDRPELDGVRTFDFEPLGFTVVEAPPPTTVEAPPELIPPITAVNPVEVRGEQITRPAAPPAAAAAPAATLPNTGDGTLGIALAGLGSLLVGGAALWWGARHARRHPAELLD